jgi:hypothetical protein
VGTEPSVAQRPPIRCTPDPAREANLYLGLPAVLASLAIEVGMAGYEPVPGIAACALEPRHTLDLLARLNGEAGVVRALARDEMPDRSLRIPQLWF